MLSTVAFVEEAVDHRGGDDGVGENLVPVAEAAVGGEARRARIAGVSHSSSGMAVKGCGGGDRILHNWSSVHPFARRDKAAAPGAGGRSELPVTPDASHLQLFRTEVS
jgi:hypothetical protein